ncbi:MAG: hypothetical protein K2M56_06820 [Muribaculaceae bacterium]|nr:hypothetical protein [Muribaculaceae bacterium]
MQQKQAGIVSMVVQPVAPDAFPHVHVLVQVVLMVVPADATELVTQDVMEKLMHGNKFLMPE